MFMCDHMGEGEGPRYMSTWTSEIAQFSFREQLLNLRRLTISSLIRFNFYLKLNLLCQFKNLLCQNNLIKNPTNVRQFLSLFKIREINVILQN